MPRVTPGNGDTGVTTGLGELALEDTEWTDGCGGPWTRVTRHPKEDSTVHKATCGRQKIQ